MDQEQEEKLTPQGEEGNSVTFIDDGSGSPMCLEVKNGIKKNLEQIK